MKNKHVPNLIIWLTEHVPKDMLQILVVFFLDWNLFETVYFWFPQLKS